ncbi:MAG: DUF2723 domain-containing protein [Paludibacteraceae bacterium]|nr:DUF2723 domain-containing protein [Paludibacteraceae bacterium]
MKRFKQLNNIVGWVVCAIACAVYLLTIEPTASFWDCGEFIATSYKMEIGHPPGAPFFMMLGRICSLFAATPSQVAAMVNAFSAICSGFTILFLFWTITHLARRMEVPNEVFKSNGEVPLATTIGILGAGVVGALAYTFSDTFWFSAVEGEVYASSSLFTAVVYWCMLKWEDCADEPYANRWLVLIAYLMGLSIGVHLLNLLSIPVLVLVYYYRKSKEVTTKGTIVALAVSCVVLVCILYGLIPGFAQVAGWFELLFVNGFHCPYNTGVIIYAIALLGALVWGIKLTSNNNTLSTKATKGSISHLKVTEIFIASIILLGIPFFGSGKGSHIALAILIIVALGYGLYNYGDKVQMPVLNTILICCAMVLLGYSTYAPLVIRSAANPTMDENSPDDVFSLKSYLNREQYGDRPLIFGESYAADYHRVNNGNGQWTVDVEEGEALYAKAIKANDSERDQYIHYDNKKDYKYCSEFNMLFPRMYSRQGSHINAYKEWGAIGEGKTITYQNMGQMHTANVPTQFNNILFFLKYQVGFMYWRYFMWNFVGRQNDIQGHGEVQHGNWCSGIGFIDSMLNGADTSLVPDQLKNNKGHNCYYFLPLILGLLGILYQFDAKKDEKGEERKEGMQSFWQVCILFFLTGLAIVIYLNQTPYQPRERDYAYAGSFYAFAIWIGLGVLFVYGLIKKFLDPKIAATLAAVACLGVPALMAQQNWDDHDRSNRYTCRDFGGDYLRSLAPNAIIFTNGDNDTFPLWYNQEVEGDCKDDSLKAQYQNKRVANLSYLQMAWYVSQMTRDAYESKGVDLSLEEADYSMGKLDVAYVVDAMKGQSLNVVDAIKLLKDPVLQNNVKKRVGMDAEDASIIPCTHLYLEVDSAEAVNNAGAAPEKIHTELNNFRYELQKNILNNASLNPEQKRAELAKLLTLKTYRINIDLSSKRYLGKHEIFILDLLANNHWKRPVYYAVTVGGDSKLGLQPYFRLEGMAYRVMPYHCGSRCETNIMYDNLMRKFEFGNASDPNVYLEENNLRMCSTFRNMYVMLAGDLYEEGKKDSCLKVLDYVMEKLPSTTVPMGEYDLGIVDIYYRLGKTEIADKYAAEMVKTASQYVTWFSAMNQGRRRSTSYEFSKQRRLLATLGGLLQNYNRKEMVADCELALNQSAVAFQEISAAAPSDGVSYDDEED